MKSSKNTSGKPCIAVSACLLGHPCRYDGASKPNADVIALENDYRIVPVCPEVEGGLPVPHPPCEIVAGEEPLRVVDESGRDMTRFFKQGALASLERAVSCGCTAAVLKAKSPSCGSGLVYDGTFSGELVNGWGVAASLLREEGITVVDETQVGSILHS